MTGFWCCHGVAGLGVCRGGKSECRTTIALGITWYEGGAITSTVAEIYPGCYSSTLYEGEESAAVVAEILPVFDVVSIIGYDLTAVVRQRSGCGQVSACVRFCHGV